MQPVSNNLLNDFNTQLDKLKTFNDERLQDLMDRNNNGQLSQKEREELEALVEWSENLSLLRAKVLRCLGRKL